MVYTSRQLWSSHVFTVHNFTTTPTNDGTIDRSDRLAHATLRPCGVTKNMWPAQLTQVKARQNIDGWIDGWYIGMDLLKYASDFCISCL